MTLSGEQDSPNLSSFDNHGLSVLKRRRMHVVSRWKHYGSTLIGFI
jgi:hypothetical protein